MTNGKSGAHTILCGGMSSVYLTVEWAELVDSTANTSVLTITGLRMNAGVWAGRYYINGTISVNGTVIARLENNAHQVYINTTGSPAYEAYGTYPFRSGVIAHQADGSGSAVLSINLNGSNQTSGQHYYASEDIAITLTSIPRASSVSCAGGEIGGAVPISITSAASGFRHRLRYHFGQLQGEIASNLQGGVFNWTPPMELCGEIPHTDVGRGSVYCDTYQSGALVGTTRCELILTVPRGVGLQVSEAWVRVEPVQTGGAEGLDCWVQGKSCVSAVFDESGISYEQAYGTQPAKVTVTVENSVYPQGTASHAIRGSGTVPVICTVTDTRGRTVSLVREISVLPYAAPVFGAAEVFRSDEAGQPQNEGSCISCKAGWTVSTLEGRNEAEVRAYLIPVGGSRGEGVLLREQTAQVLWTGLVSPERSYEVWLEAVDCLGQRAIMTVTIPTAKVFFHGRSGGNGGAFGKYAEADDLLEVAWSLKTKGDLVVEGQAVIGGKTLQDWLHPVGSVCFCSGEAVPHALYGGVWEETALEQMRGYVRKE